VPTLVIHGDADRIVPFSAAGQRTAKLINGAELVVIKDGPHNVAWTHAEEVNNALVSFLAKPAAKGQALTPKTKAVAQAGPLFNVSRSRKSVTDTLSSLAKR